MTFEKFWAILDEYGDKKIVDSGYALLLSPATIKKVYEKTMEEIQTKSAQWIPIEKYK
jgi:hypothetical protein